MKQSILLLYLFISTVAIAQKKTDQEILSIAVKELRSSAKSIQTGFPAASKFKDARNLTKKGKDLFADLSALIEQAAGITDKATKDEYIAIVSKLNAAIKELSASGDGKSAKKNSGTGIAGGNGGIFNDTGNTCVTNCRMEYNQCKSENQCESHWGVCICCVPCSLQYLGCVRKCVLF